MMITVNRADFTHALSIASSVIETRSTVPVLTHLRVRANGALVLEGSDLDRTTRVELPYTGKEVDFCLPSPARIRTALNRQSGDAVAIGLDPASRKSCSDKVSLHCGELSAGLTTLPADDHPGSHAIGFEEFAADLGAAELRQIARLLSAISREETRYYLNGICVWHLADWTYRFAATDGHRLMMVDIPLPGATGTLEGRPILPRSWIETVLRQFIRAKDGCRLAYGREAVRNISDGVELDLKPGGLRISVTGQLGRAKASIAGKLIDGTFPDVMRVVPATADWAITVDKAALIKALESLSPFSSEKLRAVKLQLDAAGRATLSLKSPILGDAAIGLPVDLSPGAPKGFEIGFNAQYLRDIANAITGEEITLAFTGAATPHANPVLIGDPADTALTAVLMPMRV